MRVAVDTNVLVRFLVRDDEAQAEMAKAAIDAADTIVIPTIVLCELAWVLKRAVRMAPRDIADHIGELVRSRNVELDRAAAEAGLQALAKGGDFADGVIRHEARRQRCDQLLTFDRGFAGLFESADVVLLDASGS